MKKKLAIVLAGMMLSTGVAMAEVDLKSMSFDELVDLQSQILEEVVSREEFKCVSVPAGEYTVGVDIPAGDYTIASNTKSSMVTLYVNGFESAYYLTSKDPVVGKLTLKDGDIVSTSGTLDFSTYKGLGF
nr:MAG TPA: hypothetical protein [Caudoviricetes sp.]